MPSSIRTFPELFAAARASAVHLEMRDAYGVDDEAADFARGRSTGVRDLDPSSPYRGSNDRTDVTTHPPTQTSNPGNQWSEH
jgi:hypothetical protein